MDITDALNEIPGPGEPTPPEPATPEPAVEEGGESGRPGGPSPAARIESLEAKVAELLAAKAAAVNTRKGARSTADELEATVGDLRGEIEGLRLESLVAGTNPVNASTVVRLLRGAADPAAALTALQDSDPYLFKPAAPSKQSPDPENGQRRPAAAGDELGEYLRSTLGG